jgi:AraC-like DNA-binding protein
MMSRQDSLALGVVFNEAALRYYPALDRVDQYVHAHISHPLSLQDAARVAHLERKYFSAFFRSKVGIPFREWLRLLRIRRAMELMRVRWELIPRIAFAAGFGDVRSFERAFKRVTGMTPEAFRSAIEQASR